MRLSLWPQSLFGRLLAASVLALLLAEAASLVLVARERERFVLQGNVREWSRRIAEVTTMLQGLQGAERDAAAQRLTAGPLHFGRRADGVRLRSEADEDGEPPRRGARDTRGSPSPGGRFDRSTASLPFVPFATQSEFEHTFAEQLQTTLGRDFRLSVSPTTDPSRRAISITGTAFAENRDGPVELYDATVGFPDGYTAVFRVGRVSRGPPLPRGLFLNLILLIVVMLVALFVTARSITHPLSELARAADRVGRDLRQPRLAERGARELRHAARAFNTMQDRLQRYLDSRSRVLAAMSHDLKTPLTRLRLQVETLEDPVIQARFGKQLDEMESMVHGALALFRGLDDNEAFAPIDMDALLRTLQSEFAEMNASVILQGRALRPISAKPQALRRCLTNLIANAVKFGSRATIVIEDGQALILRIRDEGPGIPEEELERVFEPFYRLETSRNRDTGGTGLGLSIARDVAQAHGGSLVLHNLPVRGLEAVLTLPRIS
ncbi:MAG TPA: HAMP domain-containing sensor histidine kinase [Steroidobacteraceae bacterium]|nr:HAMP domain-containing sensor histidine kinase [Steroidobacteraceae bacterium]